MKFPIIRISLALFGICTFHLSAYAEELKIKYPDIYFGSTPIEYFGENFEETSYKLRPNIHVPEGTINISKGKKVTSSVEKPEFGKLEFINDGDKNYEHKSVLGLATGIQWVQIDLGQQSELYALALWHFHEGDRVYFDVVVKVADDAGFTKNVRDVFNNDHDNSSKTGRGKDKEYIETFQSRLVNLKGIKARYIRFYSNGNTENDFNHYVEAEVYGK